MVWIKRFLFLLVIGAMSAAILAQQGGMGGGGFGGGGFQGGRADFTDDSETFRKQLFLSPGDRTEWSFEAKENEAVLVKVTSSVFDPAVAIHDEKGTKLIENDDIEPGNQMAQLIFMLPKAGKYKAVVTNYKGTAGGQFEFVVQRFLAVEAKMGQPAVAEVGDKRAWIKVDIEKPGDYSVALRAANGAGSLAVHGPNGEALDELQHIDHTNTYQRRRFEAKEKGAYFIRTSATKPTVRVSPVVSQEIKTGSTSAASLAQDELHDWTIAAKKNDLLEISIPGDATDLMLEVRSADRFDDGRAHYTILRAPSIDKKYALAVINDGPVTVSVRNSKGAASSYQLRVAPIGKPWTASDTLTSSLDWFETEYWTVEAKTGDVLKLRASSPIYNTHVTVMAPEGWLMHAGMIGKTPEVGLTLPVQVSGRYVIVVSGGGIGDYKLTKEITPPKRLTVGETIGDARGAPDVWRFTGKKGQDFAFRVESKSLRWSVQIIGPDGRVVGNLNNPTGTGDDFIRLKVPADGDYSVVVTGFDGTTGAYTIKWIDLDK